MNWKHFCSFLLTIAFTQWDVTSDIKNGLAYLQSREVRRTFSPAWYPAGIPPNCTLYEVDDTLIHDPNTTMEQDPNSTLNYDPNTTIVQDLNSTMPMLCTERDPVWGAASLALVQAPMWIGGGFLMAVVLMRHFQSALENCCGCYDVYLFFLAGTLLLQFVPYPLMILSVQLLYLVKPKYKIRGGRFDLLDLVMILVSLEAAGEAGPQALLQLYIALTDWERGVSTLLIITLISSIFTIAKAAIPSFSSRSGNGDDDEKSLSDGDPSSVVAFYTSTLRFLPLFGTSIVFRVTSATITLVLLKGWGFIPLALGTVAITTLSSILNKEQDEMFPRIVSAVIHGLGGVAVLTKSFFDDRNQTKKPMMISSCVWLVVHTLSFLVIIAMVSNPELHLQHWKNTARIPLLAEDSVHLLYIIICCLILTGIVNTALVWYQVYNEDWDQVNWDVRTRMRWRRGEVAGGWKETGILEPSIRSLVDKLEPSIKTFKGKLLDCWNCIRCKTSKQKNEDNSTSQGLNFVSVVKNEEIPPNAFPLTVFKGETLFIGRVFHEGLYVPGYVDTSIPGYEDESGDVEPSVGCVTSWDLKGSRSTYYEVLVQEPGQHKLYWVDGEKGRPEDLGAAVVGTTAEGGPMYVARAEVDGVWRAGKINPRYKEAFIGYLGEDIDGDKVWKEMMVEDYQVLCCKKSATNETADTQKLPV